MEEQATEKQINFMKQLEIDCNPGTTKVEARMLIDMKLRANEKTNEEIEVEKIPINKVTGGLQTMPKKDNGFEAHFSIETVRSNALASSIELTKYLELTITDIKQIIETAKNFEQYILTGE